MQEDVANVKPKDLPLSLYKFRFSINFPGLIVKTIIKIILTYNDVTVWYLFHTNFQRNNDLMRCWFDLAVVISIVTDD